MAQERIDLIAICQTLSQQIYGPQGDNADSWNCKTDLELLRYIVDELNKLAQLSEISDPLAFSNLSRTSQLVNSNETKFWTELEKFNNLLKQDYTCRREMLLNRLDCTVESFKWKSNEESEKNNERIHNLYDSFRDKLKPEPNVDLSHLLSTRLEKCDTLLNCVVSSTKGIDPSLKPQIPTEESISADKQVNLKQIIIPDVPDRGGRPEEIRAPTRETFSQQRRGQRGRFSGNKGHRGR